jgi:Protein of unknown function (DUF3866)
VLDATAGLGGVPIAALRFSAADPRARHRGVSHHSITALTIATRCRALVAMPEELDPGVAGAAIAARHELVPVATVGIVELMAARGLRIESMGRRATIRGSSSARLRPGSSRPSA